MVEVATIQVLQGADCRDPGWGCFAAIPYGTSYTTSRITGLLSIDINKLGNDDMPLTLAARWLCFCPYNPFSYLRQ